MFTPYDWQEGIGNRASYIESRLAQGAPVLAKSLPDGILLFTYRRQAKKIYEVYDRIVYSGVGQQSDIVTGSFRKRGLGSIIGVTKQEREYRKNGLPFEI